MGQIGLGKRSRPRSDCTTRSSLIRICTACKSVCIVLNASLYVSSLCVLASLDAHVRQSKFCHFLREFPCLSHLMTDLAQNEGNNLNGGARWPSSRASDSGARGQGFETYLRCAVSLSKTLYSPKVLIIPRKQWLRPDMTETLLTGTLSLTTNKQTILMGCKAQVKNKIMFKTSLFTFH